MTKIFCFIRGCNESEFGVAEPSQTHVNTHLRDIHGLAITAANAKYYKRRQNEAWQARYIALLAERSRVVKQIKDEFQAFTNDPSLPLPTGTLDEDVEIAWAAVMNTTDDAEPVEEGHSSKGVDAKASSEWFGSGPGYAVSFRSKVFRKQNAEEEARLILGSVPLPEDLLGDLPRRPRSVVALSGGNSPPAKEETTLPRKEDSPVEITKPEDKTQEPLHGSEVSVPPGISSK